MLQAQFASLMVGGNSIGFCIWCRFSVDSLLLYSLSILSFLCLSPLSLHSPLYISFLSLLSLFLSLLSLSFSSIPLSPSLCFSLCFYLPLFCCCAHVRLYLLSLCSRSAVAWLSLVSLCRRLAVYALLSLGCLCPYLAVASPSVGFRHHVFIHFGLPRAIQQPRLRQRQPAAILHVSDTACAPRISSALPDKFILFYPSFIHPSSHPVIQSLIHSITYSFAYLIHSSIQSFVYSFISEEHKLI